MSRLKEFVVRRGLLLSGLALLVILPSFAVAAGRASRVRKELETDLTFVERARAAALELGAFEGEGFHCSAPLVSKRPGQALFGVSRAVAFVAAPPGQRLAWPGEPAELLVGPGGCVRRIAALEAMRAYTGLGRQLEEAAHTPWRQLDRLFEVGELPVCMGSQSTDFGVVLVPHLADDGQQLAGRVDVRVIDFSRARPAARAAPRCGCRRPRARSSSRSARWLARTAHWSSGCSALRRARAPRADVGHSYESASTTSSFAARRAGYSPARIAQTVATSSICPAVRHG